MVVFADCERFAKETFGGQLKQRRLGGVIGHRFLFNDPIIAVPRPSGKSRMLPVSMGVDKIHIALGIQSERPKNNCSGYKRFAAQVFFDEVSHLVEVSLFRFR